MNNGFIKLWRELNSKLADFPDAALKVYIHIEELRELSFVMHYSVMREDVQVFHGHTKMIAFDYEKRRITEIPESFISTL